MDIEPISIHQIIVRNRIRDLRRESSITQEELAKRLGVSRQSIISVETGKCLPSVPLAFAISRFFQSPLEQLFVLENDDNDLGTSNVPLEDTMREISPFRGASSLHEAIDRMFEESIAPLRRGGMVPSMNIYQTPKEIVVEADVPGMTEDDVDIEIRDGVLTIKGERKEEAEQKDKEYFHREVSFGSFQRAVTLPTEVMPDKATATVTKGQLKVVLPKAEPEQPKVHKLKAKAE